MRSMKMINMKQVYLPLLLILALVISSSYVFGGRSDTPSQQQPTSTTYEQLLAKESASSQMECVYVRKNDDLSSVLSGADKRYIIQFDHDLKNTVITIGKNSVLDFQGGHINNGTVCGNNTTIKAEPVDIFGTGVTINGSWSIVEAYPEWFAGNIQIALNNFPCVKLIKPQYQIDYSLLLNGGNSLISDIKSKVTINSKGKYGIWLGYNSYISDIYFIFSPGTNGIRIDGDYLAKSWLKSKFGNKGDYSARGVHKLMMNNCTLYKHFESKDTSVGMHLSAHGGGGNYSTTDGTRIGNYYSNGITGVNFDNLKFDGAWTRNIEIENTTEKGASVDGWITDVSFSNCLFNYANKDNIYIHQDKVLHNQIPPTVISFVNCTVQHNPKQDYYCRIKDGRAIKFINNETWDWDWVAKNPIPPFYIDPRNSCKIVINIGQQFERSKWVDIPDWTDRKDGYSSSKIKYGKCPYKITLNDHVGYEARLEDFLVGNKNSNINFVLLPEGRYTVSASVLSTLGIPCRKVSHAYLSKVSDLDGVVELKVEGVIDNKKRSLICYITSKEGDSIQREWME